MTIEDDVRAASTKFYSALNRMLNGDAGSLGDIWSHSATVTTMLYFPRKNGHGV